jgi:hypothetical protein
MIIDLMELEGVDLDLQDMEEHSFPIHFTGRNGSFTTKYFTIRSNKEYLINDLWEQVVKLYSYSVNAPKTIKKLLCL